MVAKQDWKSLSALNQSFHFIILTFLSSLQKSSRNDVIRILNNCKNETIDDFDRLALIANPCATRCRNLRTRFMPWASLV